MRFLKQKSNWGSLRLKTFPVIKLQMDASMIFIICPCLESLHRLLEQHSIPIAQDCSTFPENGWAFWYPISLQGSSPALQHIPTHFLSYLRMLFSLDFSWLLLVGFLLLWVPTVGPSWEHVSLHVWSIGLFGLFTSPPGLWVSEVSMFSTILW